MISTQMSFQWKEIVFASCMKNFPFLELRVLKYFIAIKWLEKISFSKKQQHFFFLFLFHKAYKFVLITFAWLGIKSWPIFHISDWGDQICLQEYRSGIFSIISEIYTFHSNFNVTCCCLKWFFTYFLICSHVKQRCLKTFQLSVDWRTAVLASAHCK